MFVTFFGHFALGVDEDGCEVNIDVAISVVGWSMMINGKSWSSFSVYRPPFCDMLCVHYQIFPDIIEYYCYFIYKTLQI